jgi:hypothetical protein
MLMGVEGRCFGMRPPQRKVRHGRAEPTSTLSACENGRSPDEAAELLRERDQLRQAMESRPVIDMACGVLMAGFACEPEEALKILVAVSQHANVKLREVAEAVTAMATGKPMPAELPEHLAAAVQAWQVRHGHRSSG